MYSLQVPDVGVVVGFYFLGFSRVFYYAICYAGLLQSYFTDLSLFLL